MKSIKRLFVLIIIYAVLSSISGITRSNIFFSIFEIDNTLVTYSSYTSIIITVLISCLFLLLIFYFSWYSNLILNKPLTLSKYYDGILGFVICLVMSEMVKFMYTKLFFRAELLGFNKRVSIQEQLNSSIFMQVSHNLDYTSYILGLFMFIAILFKKKIIGRIMVMGIVVTTFLFFTKYVTNYYA